GGRGIEVSGNRRGADVAVAHGEAPADRTLSIRSERLAEPPTRLRALELSETQVLVAAMDSRRRLTWWTVMPDPRTVRAETADEQGQLTDGRSLYPAPAASALHVPHADH